MLGNSSICAKMCDGEFYPSPGLGWLKWIEPLGWCISGEITSIGTAQP